MLLVLEQVEYDIDLDKFLPGRSFFILALKPRKTRALIKRYMDSRKLEVFMKIVIEDGVQGVRVWRIC